MEIVARNPKGLVVGNIIASKVNRETANIGRVGVRVQFRNCGWGKKLLDQVESLATDNNVAQMTSTLMPEPGCETALLRLFESGGYMVENGRASKELTNNAR